jgi:hypothetical protein
LLKKFSLRTVFDPSEIIIEQFNTLTCTVCMHIFYASSLSCKLHVMIHLQSIPTQNASFGAQSEFELSVYHTTAHNTTYNFLTFWHEDIESSEYYREDVWSQNFHQRILLSLQYDYNNLKG